MPDSIKSYVEEHESFSVSNFSNRGQGGDFIKEEAIKTIKSFLPPGMLSSEIWERVCRKVATLKGLKEPVWDTTTGKEIRYKKDLHEVTMIKREIRAQNLESKRVQVWKKRISFFISVILSMLGTGRVNKDFSPGIFIFKKW